jgi:ABC-type transport system substrate-binding protein
MRTVYSDKDNLISTYWLKRSDKHEKIDDDSICVTVAVGARKKCRRPLEKDWWRVVNFMKEGHVMMKRRTWGTLFVILMVLLLGQVSSAADPRKLLVAITVEPASLEPCLASAGNDLNIAINIAEYLISPTPSGRLEPGLATSWKASPDGKKIEFTLRKGVKFHSGDPFTAKDVQFSFQRAVKNDNIKISLTGIERFEIVDDYHLNIHFKTPDVTFIPSWARVLISSKSYYDRVGEDAYTRTPVGTGPYNFVRYMPGEYVDMERFEGYWGRNLK